MIRRFKHKFNAVKTYINGIKFDSRLEASFYGPLLAISKSHELTLTLQHKIPIYNYNSKNYYYIADFILTDKEGKMFIVDAKGIKLQNSMTKIRIAVSKTQAGSYVGSSIRECLLNIKKFFTLD